MRLAMVQLVLVNLKSFYPMAGYDLMGNGWDTPLTLSHNCIRNVDRCRFFSTVPLFISRLIQLCLCLLLLVPLHFPRRHRCRSARGLSAVSRRVENAAALGAGPAEEAGTVRRTPLQVHRHPPAGRRGSVRPRLAQTQSPVRALQHAVQVRPWELWQVGPKKQKPQKTSAALWVKELNAKLS